LNIFDNRGGLNIYGLCGNDGINRLDYLGNSWLIDLSQRNGCVFSLWNRYPFNTEFSIASSGTAQYCRSARRSQSIGITRVEVLWKQLWLSQFPYSSVKKLTVFCRRT